MFRGHWRKISALGLIVTALLSFGSAFWLITDANSLESLYEQQAKTKAEAYAERSNVAIQRRCAALPAKQQVQCIREERQAAREGQHDERDLQAQLVTSVWTRYMGIAAMIGMGVGILGVGLVFFTFQETRRTADEAKRSADAFINAERPHLRAVKRGNFTDPKHPSERLIALGIENFGQSPAIVELVSWEPLQDVNFPGVERFTRAKKHDTNLAAGAKAMDVRFHVLPDTKFVGGYVRYRSRFKPNHMAYFLFAVTKNEGTSGLSLMPRYKSKGWPDDS